MSNRKTKQCEVQCGACEKPHCQRDDCLKCSQFIQDCDEQEDIQARRPALSKISAAKQRRQAPAPNAAEEDDDIIVDSAVAARSQQQQQQRRVSGRGRQQQQLQEDEDQDEAPVRSSRRQQAQRRAEPQTLSEMEDDLADEEEEPMSIGARRDGGAGADGEADEQAPEASEDQWLTTKVAFHLSASALELATRGSDEIRLSLSRASADAPDIFQLASANAGGASSALIGDAAGGKRGQEVQHAVGSVELTRVVSTYPVTLGLNVTGLTTDGVCRTITADGRKQLGYVVVPRQASDALSVDLIARQEKPHSFLKDYPTWNEGNINQGIVKLGNGRSMVSREHPLIAVINHQLTAEGKDPLTPEHRLHTQKMYTLPTAMVNASKKQLKEGLRTQVRMTKASDLGISVTRAFGATEDGAKPGSSWLHPDELLRNLTSDAARKQAASTVYSLYVEAKITFRPTDGPVA
jgi:hypothetical protein